MTLASMAFQVCNPRTDVTSDAPFNSADFAVHKATCKRVKEMRDKMPDEADKICHVIEDDWTPTITFETDVERFWVLTSPWPYMDVKLEVIRALSTIRSRPAIEAALAEVQEMATGKDRDYDCANMELPFINVRGADMTEDLPLPLLNGCEAFFSSALVYIKMHLVNATQDAINAYRRRQCVGAGARDRLAGCVLITQRTDTRPRRVGNAARNPGKLNALRILDDALSEPALWDSDTGPHADYIVAHAAALRARRYEASGTLGNAERHALTRPTRVYPRLPRRSSGFLARDAAARTEAPPHSCIERACAVTRTLQSPIPPLKTLDSSLELFDNPDGRVHEIEVLFTKTTPPQLPDNHQHHLTVRVSIARTMLGRVLPTAARAALAPFTINTAALAVVRRPTLAVATPFRVASVTDAFAQLRVIEEPLPSHSLVMECLNRNARRPKKANHGKRPCSHFRRRQKRLSRRNAAK